MLLWVFLLVPLAIGLLAQRRVRDTFRRYRDLPDRSGFTGAQVARRLLDAHGLTDIGIEVAPGVLSDHYDPTARVLRLSPDVGARASVASIGIAAHEVAHAYQDAEGSRVYRLRKRIAEPLSRLAPLSGPILVGGFWFNSVPLMVIASVYIAGLVLFSVVTLPVELEASHRAIDVLERTGIAAPDEIPEIREVLRAAAFTYIAGIAQQAGIFIVVLVTAGAAFGVPAL